MKNEITKHPVDDFTEVLFLIEQARENAYRAVNRELIAMYWEIGRYVSEKVKSEGWGKSVVQRFSDYIQSHFAGIKGFSPKNIWRMRQFYETYAENEFLSPLVRELGWANNLLIMMAAKTDEERKFYLLLSAKNNYSKRELERQIDSRLYERTMISAEKNKLALTTKRITHATRRPEYSRNAGMAHHVQRPDVVAAVFFCYALCD
jgi:predicted nuclease of restriction endonuclease-like (RecB) superfamily